MTYDVIIVGAGPAGLSTALHAKLNGLRTLVLEQGALANTIVDYHRGKHVMDEPTVIPVRSDLPFRAGSREAVLEMWEQTVAESDIEIRCPEKVDKVVATGEEFTVQTDKTTYHGRNVVLAIGVQGTPRSLNVPGEQSPHVSSHLVDPNLYHDLDIIVVGAGDAAIEEALALSESNRVVIVNRSKEFYRLKETLEQAIIKKVEAGKVSVFHNATVERIDEDAVDLRLPDGTTRIKAHVVFKRVGAEGPRAFLETMGVVFLASKPVSRPDLGANYETSTRGLYLIGAAAGFGLIKQGINQGYDVIEHILGHDVEPVDEPLLREKLRNFPGSTEEALTKIIATVPMLSTLTPPKLREIFLDSEVHNVQSGQVIFKEHDFSDSFYIILTGSVGITFAAQAAEDGPIVLRKGDFFGEMSLLSGRRRSGTVKASEPSVLLEIPRKTALRLLSDDTSVKRVIDETFILRAFRDYLFPGVAVNLLQELAANARLRTFGKGEAVFHQDDVGDAFYLIRNGSVKVSQRVRDETKEIVINYLPAGRYFGEMALLESDDVLRSATVTATTRTEVIQVMKKDFDDFLQGYPDFERKLRQGMQKTLIRAQEVILRKTAGKDVFDELITEGVFQGTNVLLIDQNKCVRCDECVKACADTHDGHTRLDRTQGIAFANRGTIYERREKDNYPNGWD